VAKPSHYRRLGIACAGVVVVVLASLLGAYSSGSTSSASAKPRPSSATPARGDTVTAQVRVGGRSAREEALAAERAIRSDCPANAVDERGFGCRIVCPENQYPVAGGGCREIECYNRPDAEIACQVSRGGDTCGQATEVEFTITNNTGQVLKRSAAYVWPAALWCKKSIYPGYPPATLKPGETVQLAAGSQYTGSEARIAYNLPNGEELSVQAAASDGLTRPNGVSCTPSDLTNIFTPPPIVGVYKSVCVQKPVPGGPIPGGPLGIKGWQANTNEIGWLLQEKGRPCIPTGPLVCAHGGSQGISAEPSPTTTKPTTKPRPTFIPP
jgi:hypothetical protein